MKILLVGATGFIGGEILEQCLADARIQQIFVLTRRELDRKWSQHRKVHQILHVDFLEYPDPLLERLRDAGVAACMWALGGTVSKLGSVEEAQKVNVHYTLHAAEAFARTLGPATVKASSTAAKKKETIPFRFVFISGWGAEQNQYRSLWMFAQDRKTKGAAERGLFEVADNATEVEGIKCFQAYALRVGGVLSKGDSIKTLVTEAIIPSCTVDRLAKCAVRTALEGAQPADKRILENAEILGPDWAEVNSLSM